MTAGHVQVKTGVTGICLHHSGFIAMNQMNFPSYTLYPASTLKNIKPSSPDTGEMEGLISPKLGILG